WTHRENSFRLPMQRLPQWGPSTSLGLAVRVQVPLRMTAEDPVPLRMTAEGKAMSAPHYPQNFFHLTLYNRNQTDCACARCPKSSFTSTWTPSSSRWKSSLILL